MNPGGAGTLSWPRVDLGSATLGLDSLDVATPLGAQAAVAWLSGTGPVVDPGGSPFEQVTTAASEAARVLGALR